MTCASPRLSAVDTLITYPLNSIINVPRKANTIAPSPSSARVNQRPAIDVFSASLVQLDSLSRAPVKCRRVGVWVAQLRMGVELNVERPEATWEP